MANNVKKILKQMEKRESIKQKALQKGWRSRFTLLFKAWSDVFGMANHLEWLGFYDEAMRVRAKYKLGPKEIAKLYGAMFATGATAVANSALHEGVYNSNNNTVTYGHIDNTGNLGPIFGFIAGMIYNVKEQNKITFGGYKEDAFGLPVRWFKPKNVDEIRKAALEREAAKQGATTQQGVSPTEKQNY